MSHRTVGLSAVALLAASALAAQAQPDAAVTAVRAPGNVFGGRETEFVFRAPGRVAWRLAAGTATLAAGAREAAGGVVSIKLPVPPVTDGVVLHARLTVSPAGGGKAVERDVWVFPEDPFAGRAAWLKGLNLHLYDPPGKTAAVLAAAKVPVERVRDVDAAARVAAGVLVVGEGVSFRAERGLAAALDDRAAAGVAVLCLAPAAGELVVPGLGGPARGQLSLAFRRDPVRWLDKRLDPDGWAAGGATVAVKAGEDGAAGVVTPAGGWPWVEARFAPGPGRWAVCGLPVIARWDASPAPRFFLARMLDYLTTPDPDANR